MALQDRHRPGCIHACQWVFWGQSIMLILLTWRSFLLQVTVVESHSVAGGAAHTFQVTVEAGSYTRGSKGAVGGVHGFATRRHIWLCKHVHGREQEAHTGFRSKWLVTSGGAWPWSWPMTKAIPRRMRPLPRASLVSPDLV